MLDGPTKNLSILHCALKASLPVWALLLLCACASGKGAAHRAANFTPLDACLARYQYWDAQVKAAGLQDAAAHRLKAYPYLRSNRFLASFAGQLGSDDNDSEQFIAWLFRLRALDQISRRVELQNLGLLSLDEEIAKLDACGQALIARLTAQDKVAILATADVPSDYSRLARVLGFYPFAVPFLRLGIQGYQKEIRQDYAKPLDNSLSAGRLIHWLPKTSTQPKPVDVASLPKDSMGVPSLSPEQWLSLANRFAPSWWIETKSPADLPGVPTLQLGVPQVDTREASVYYQPSFTRFGDAVLVQMSYVIWFSERPAMGPLDSYAGPFDGLIWRVTLDEQGVPLAYDTIHACGCYHYFYAAQALQRQPSAGFWQEPKLLPQEDVGQQPLALRVQSGTHYLRRVVSRAEVTNDSVATYQLKPYQQLLSLPLANGRTGSLFDEQGLLPISARLERYWLWPSGVKNPGAMRQWGRHATAFIGEAYFDEARLLERVFMP